jgi:hypothetical protein
MTDAAKSKRRDHFNHLVSHKHLIERSDAALMAYSIAERGTFYSEALSRSVIPKITESALRAAMGDAMPIDWQAFSKEQVLDLFERAIGRLA